MAAAQTVQDIAVSIVSFVGRMSRTPQPNEPAFAIRMALISQNVNQFARNARNIDFMIEITNGAPNEIKEALAECFPYSFTLYPEGLVYRERMAGQRFVKVEVRLSCAQLYGCDPGTMPQIGSIHGYVAQSVAVSDLVVFLVCSLMHTPNDDKRALLRRIKNIVLNAVKHGRHLGLTWQQKQLVQGFLPELPQPGLPEIAWKLIFWLPRPKSQQ